MEYELWIENCTFAVALVRTFALHEKRLKGNAVKFGNSPAAVNSNMDRMIVQINYLTFDCL